MAGEGESGTSSGKSPAAIVNTHNTLVRLFEHVPHRWSLRGNSHLWSEMQARLADCAFPAAEEALMSLLEQTYHQLTGAH